MKFFKILFSLLILAAAQSSVQAAITGVTFKIVYNPATCMYDVKMTIVSGSVTTATDQEAYTAQVTLVVPTGTVVGTGSIVSNEPKVGSNTGGVVTRTVPESWTNTNTEVNNSALPGYDVYAFIPSLTNGYYGVLNTNDVVTLFSIPIATSSCGAGIRLWNNNTILGSPVLGGDPTSANFSGLDYNNGHDFSSTASVYQTYTGNGTSNVTPPNPTLSLTPTYIPTVKFADTSTAAAGSLCAGSLSYSWTGPNSFTATTPNINIAPVSSINYGTYTLTVRDGNGCTQSDFTTITASPLELALNHFDVSADKCSARLSWTTSSETNIDRFDVQASADGSQFTTVAQIASKRSPQGSSYSYSYKQDYQKGFYRLAVVDQAGDYTVSPVVTVNTNCDNSEITVAPNPTSGYVRVAGVNAGDQIKVVNMVGQLVQHLSAAGSTASIDLGSYPAGLYTVLVVQHDEVIKAAELVKQ